MPVCADSSVIQLFALPSAFALMSFSSLLMAEFKSPISDILFEKLFFLLSALSLKALLGKFCIYLLITSRACSGGCATSTQVPAETALDPEFEPDPRLLANIVATYLISRLISWTIWIYKTHPVWTSWTVIATALIAIITRITRRQTAYTIGTTIFRRLRINHLRKSCDNEERNSKTDCW